MFSGLCPVDVEESDCLGVCILNKSLAETAGPYDRDGDEDEVEPDSGGEMLQDSAYTLGLRSQRRQIVMQDGARRNLSGRNGSRRCLGILVFSTGSL